MAAIRGDVAAMIVDEVQGVADLAALDAAAEHRAHLLERAAAFDQARQRLGTIEGVSGA